ncbi:MAG: hypothetical protein IT406_02590 [Candidatus Yanofskybacteria bacterium]|nr:hypothetical protein [Candidatus Yanofskybacteria bacterium]
MARGTQSTNPPQKPHFLVIVALLLLIAGFFVLMMKSEQKRQRAAAAELSPADTTPVEVAGAPGSYYFPAIGNAWIIARYQFEAAHPELRCEYSGARQRWAFEAAPTIGHYLVCRNIAVDAQDATIP